MDNIFTTVLLAWYKENKRNLPWRMTSDPYMIWISEIILQQTRVAQGYEYFLRFVERFPDVKTLADASEEEVMKYWQGLGYYSRARNLHAAAKSMQNGIFPKTYEEVRGLKGVGDYTAAAVCSIAYNMPYAVVDGNVYRVLSRYFNIDIPIDSTEGKKYFSSLAQEMLDRKYPADYNQAIMDFGAISCTPQNPGCMFCPLSDSCLAFANGTVLQLPVKKHKPQVTSRYFNYIFVQLGDCILLRQRTADDIWKNLFEFPLVETDWELPEEEFLKSSQFRSFFVEGEVPVIKLVEKGVKHVLSHRVIYTNFYVVNLPDGSSSFPGYQRVSRDQVEQYAVSRLIHAFLEKYL